MKLNDGKVVDHMTREDCIPTDSVKSGDDDFNFVHYTGTGAYVDSDKANPAYSVS